MNRDQQFAREWIDRAPEIPYMEIDITTDGIRANISKNTDDLLKFLKTEYGIEYTDPVIDLCG